MAMHGPPSTRAAGKAQHLALKKVIPELRAYPLEEKEVYPDSCVQKQRRQEDIQEELIRLYPQPPGDGVAQSAKIGIGRKHDSLKDSTCTRAYMYLICCKANPACSHVLHSAVSVNVSAATGTTETKIAHIRERVHTNDEDSCCREPALEEAGQGDSDGRKEQNIVAAVWYGTPIVALCMSAHSVWP